MERYSEYKDSGVKWLGEIPRHWEVRKAKYLWRESFATSENGSEELLSVSQYEGVTPSKGESRSESLKGYKIVCENDLVINIMLAWLGGLGVSKCNGIVSPAYCIYKMLGDICPRYLHYLYKTPLYLAEFARHSTGVVPSRWRMYTDDFGQVLTLLPPIKEQETIANYLDSATSKIDEAIAQQQKMIDLLNERKQIIINNAVTKGLDPNVPMKDSGVEWIGEIPKHWEIRKLKSFVSKVGSGVTPRGGGSVYVDEGIMLLRSQNVYFEGFKLNDVAYITEVMDKEMGNTRVLEGDVLINITGGSIGRCCYVPKQFPRANVNQHVCIVRPHNFSTKYLYYLLRSNCSQLQVDLQQTGGNREGLTSAALKNFILPIPSEKEHESIIEYLDNKVQKLQSLIDICSKQISLLQERKQIIINDVVTGKVKVV